MKLIKEDLDECVSGREYWDRLVFRLRDRIFSDTHNRVADTLSDYVYREVQRKYRASSVDAEFEAMKYETYRLVNVD
jgi:hypothetical protein